MCTGRLERFRVRACGQAHHVQHDAVVTRRRAGVDEVCAPQALSRAWSDRLGPHGRGGRRGCRGPASGIQRSTAASTTAQNQRSRDHGDGRTSHGLEAAYARVWSPGAASPDGAASSPSGELRFRAQSATLAEPAVCIAALGRRGVSLGKTRTPCRKLTTCTKASIPGDRHEPGSSRSRPSPAGSWWQAAVEAHRARRRVAARARLHRPPRTPAPRPPRRQVRWARARRRNQIRTC